MCNEGRDACDQWPPRDIPARAFGEEGSPSLNEKDLLRAAANATFEAIVIHSDGKVLAANRRFAEMLGYEPAEVIGKDIYDFVTEFSRGAVSRRLAEDYQEIYQSVGMRKDGSTFFAEVRGQTVFFNGRPARAASVIDVTARRLAEEELRQTQEELRQTQKVLAIGRLAAGIAHDFNNLLTIINGYNHLVMKHSGPEGDLAEAARGIQRTSRRAAALTQQLLTFSRRQIPIQRSLDLNAVVSEVDRLLERVLGEQIHLEVVQGQDLRPILADQGQLDQIILNLAINARDAMPEGGRLTISTENSAVDECGAEQTGLPVGTPMVCLQISDDGIGMNEETRVRLFEPFFTTKPRGEGTGLGLPSVQQIVRQNGGFITVQSREAEGTTFSIYFAVAGGEVHTPEPDAFEPEGTAATGTVLLVEDDDEVRNLCRESLVEAGFAVMEARNGRDALRILKAEYVPPLDLLVTDIVMPGLGGVDLAAELANRFPGLKVLFMTGYPNDLLSSAGDVIPSAEVLRKPFTPETLVLKAWAALNENELVGEA